MLQVVDDERAFGRKLSGPRLHRALHSECPPNPSHERVDVDRPPGRRSQVKDSVSLEVIPCDDLAEGRLAGSTFADDHQSSGTAVAPAPDRRFTAAELRIRTHPELFGDVRKIEKELTVEQRYLVEHIRIRSDPVDEVKRLLCERSEIRIGLLELTCQQYTFAPPIEESNELVANKAAHVLARPCNARLNLPAGFAAHVPLQIAFGTRQRILVESLRGRLNPRVHQLDERCRV